MLVYGFAAVSCTPLAYDMMCGCSAADGMSAGFNAIPSNVSLTTVTPVAELISRGRVSGWKSGVFVDCEAAVVVSKSNSGLFASEASAGVEGGITRTTFGVPRN